MDGMGWRSTLAGGEDGLAWLIDGPRRGGRCEGRISWGSTGTGFPVWAIDVVSVRGVDIFIHIYTAEEKVVLPRRTQSTQAKPKFLLRYPYP